MDDYTRLIEVFERLILAAAPCADDGTEVSDILSDVLDEVASVWSAVEHPSRELNFDELHGLLSAKYKTKVTV